MKNKYLVKELIQELIFLYYNYKLLLQVIPKYQMKYSLLVDDMGNGFSEILNEFKKIGVANYGL